MITWKKITNKTELNTKKIYLVANDKECVPIRWEALYGDLYNFEWVNMTYDAVSYECMNEIRELFTHFCEINFPK